MSEDFKMSILGRTVKVAPETYDNKELREYIEEMVAAQVLIDIGDREHEPFGSPSWRYEAAYTWIDSDTGEELSLPAFQVCTVEAMVFG